jgi:hypothetical protein
MNVLKRIAVVLLAAVCLFLTAMGTASAGWEYKPTEGNRDFTPVRCWVGFETPNFTEKYTGSQHVMRGEARLTCLNGHFIGNIPSITEFIVGQEIEAELQSKSPATGEWVTRDRDYAESQRATTIRVPLTATCFGEKLTQWRVHVTYAVAKERVKNAPTLAEPNGDEHEWYGISGPVAKRKCG